VFPNVKPLCGRKPTKKNIMQENKGKKESVRQMFNNIAGKYDFLNHFLSAGIDKIWRRKVGAIISKHQPKLVLDVATGTGDLAIELSKHTDCKIIGVDIADAMLDVGRQKLKRKGLASQIQLQHGDSEKLSFSENQFDAAMVAFGVRNFENLRKGLGEMCRVVRPGGQIVVLEFSRPRIFPVKQLYNFYFKHILPRVGRIVSRDKGAYTYLPESVDAFPDGPAFLAELENVGFGKTAEKRLTFGIATIYSGIKSKIV
jgi:demethylmenaquinone methyltransferase / 2-methoxy-6-polyprenyl-1,4-benzoquinol methylase